MERQTSKRAAMVEKLGGAPGRFVVASVVLAVLWFPFRLFLDEEDPVVEVIATAGLYGAVWALMLPVFEWIDRHVSPRRENPKNRIDAPSDGRRGALVGLAVGVPFYGALLVLCMVFERSWTYMISYSVILIAVVAVAVVRLRRARNEPR